MEILCKNCNNIVSGNYCSDCGQSSNTSRLTWGNFIANVAYGFTNIDKGFWYTLAVLFRHPGVLFREYLAGRRQSYFRPFSLLVITAGLYEVIYRIALAYWKPAAEIAGQTVEKQDMILFLMKSIGQWMITSGTALTALIIIPLYAYAIKLTFRKIQNLNYNLVEYIFVSAYMSSKRLLIRLPLIPLIVYSEVNKVETCALLLNCLLFAVTWFDLRSFFTGLSVRQSLYKTIKMYVRIGLYLVIGILLLLVLVILIIAVILLIIKLFHIESATQMFDEITILRNKYSK